MPVEFINKNVFARIPGIDANNVSRNQYKRLGADIQ